MAANPTDIREEGLTVEHSLGAFGPPIRQSNLWKDAWRRYRRNKGAVVAGTTFVAIVLFCVFWPILSPYSGNEVDFSIAKQGPSLAHPLGTDKFGRDLLTRWPDAHGFLLRGHGLYTWGATIADAERHVEILEFLLETIGRRTSHGHRHHP